MAENEDAGWRMSMPSWPGYFISPDGRVLSKYGEIEATRAGFFRLRRDGKTWMRDFTSLLADARGEHGGDGGGEAACADAKAVGSGKGDKTPEPVATPEADKTSEPVATPEAGKAPEPLASAAPFGKMVSHAAKEQAAANAAKSGAWAAGKKAALATAKKEAAAKPLAMMTQASQVGAPCDGLDAEDQNTELVELQRRYKWQKILNATLWTHLGRLEDKLANPGLGFEAKLALVAREEDKWRKLEKREPGQDMQNAKP